MMFYPIFLGSVILLNLFLGLVVLLKNPRKHINISFSLFVFSTIAWMIVNYFSNIAIDYNIALFFNKLIFLVTPYMAYSLLYFSLVFPREIHRFPVNRFKLFILFIPVVVSNIFTLTNNTITDITFLPDGGTGVIFSSLVFVYITQFIGYILAAVLVLIIKYFKSSAFQKAQLQYLIFGLLIMFILGIFTNLIIPLAFDSFFAVDIGPAFTLAVVGFTAYAILKHRLMDIRLLVARTVAYVIIVSLLSLVYGGLVFGISAIFVNAKSQESLIFIYIVLALVIAVTFQPLRNVVNKATDKIFFKDNYDSDELLAKLSKIMATTIILDDVTNKTLKEVVSTMKLTGGAFLIHDKNQFVDFINVGFSKDKSSLSKISKENMELLSRIRKTIYFEDEEIDDVKLFMRDLNVSLIVPLVVKNDFHGVLLIGDKKSGEIFSSKDISLLKIFGPEISVAIANCKAFNEIREFNITLKKEVEKQTENITKANQKLKVLDRLKDDFVSLASHELRTPMSIIKSNIWMFLHKTEDDLSEKEKTYLTRAYDSTERLIRLVNDMLNISRIESGRLRLEMKDFNINKLVEGVVSELTPRSNEVKLKLAFEKPKSKVKLVNGDSDRIEEVLINLLGNSLKFTPPGGSISVSLTPRDKDVLISISDTGRGITHEEMANLFYKFSTMGAAYLQKQQNQGTGLGLYLSKSIVELHGGKIWAESDGKDKGARFNFTIPYNEDKPHQEGKVVRSSGEKTTIVADQDDVK